MTQPSLFLFDIDGTLIKTGTSVHRDAFVRAFRQVYGLELDLSGISPAGRTDRWLLHEALRRQGFAEERIQERLAEAFELMGDWVEQHQTDLRERVLPGVPEVLQHLNAHGQWLGLLTGNIARVGRAKVRHAGLEQYFDTGGFGEESEIRADLIPVALHKAGTARGEPIPPHRAVVIGDTPLDIEAGQIAGTRTVGVATGPYTTEDLEQAGADLVLPSLAGHQEVVDLLLRLA
ncbi:MAG TPA: HAD family hydrolase [Chloroflexota bacterium]